MPWPTKLSGQVQSLSHVQFYVTPWTAACQVSLSASTPGACLHSCPSSQGCHPTISSSVVLFSSHLQSFPALGSFPMNQFFASCGRNIGVSASTPILPMNIQDWFPLGNQLYLLAVQVTLNSFLQHHTSKASILWQVAFFIVQFSNPHVTIGKKLTFD